MTILAIDPGLATCGWAVVSPTTGTIYELGTIITPPLEGCDEWTDRMRRLNRQADELEAIARRHGCTRIAAEEASLGGPPKARLGMAIALCSSWGAIVGLARSLRVSLFAVPPKVWQHAIQPGAKKINYKTLFAALALHIAAGSDCAAQLRAIKAADQNHALDACGIGILAALRPHLTTRIVERRTTT